MTFALAIETSSSPFGVIFGQDKKVLFNSLEDASLRDSRDIPWLVERGLEAIKGRVNDIGAIAVNIGPGGLSSVRSGVAFANALGFGLTIPVFPFTSFDLMGFEAWRQFQLPVLCTARATYGKAYVGLYDQGVLQAMQFGILEEITPKIIGALREFVVVGHVRSALQRLIPDSKIHDSGIQSARAEILLDRIPDTARWKNTKTDGVLPIHEYSTVFHESASASA